MSETGADGADAARHKNDIYGDDLKAQGSAEPAIPAATVILLRDDPDPRVLMLHKTSKIAFGGMWVFPGGRVELGETLQEAARREIKEETGITIRAKEPVFTFEVIDRDAAGAVRFHYVIVDLAACYVSGEPDAGDDAIDTKWISAEELHGLAVSPTTLKVLKQLFNFG